MKQTRRNLLSKLALLPGLSFLSLKAEDEAGDEHIKRVGSRYRFKFDSENPSVHAKKDKISLYWLDQEGYIVSDCNFLYRYQQEGRLDVWKLTIKRLQQDVCLICPDLWAFGELKIVGSSKF